MINELNTYAYCCEDISKIENYDKAIVDKSQTWICHHKAEVLPCGIFLVIDLKKFGLYYNRPANELIFMTKSEHIALHNKNRLPHSSITKLKISLSKKGQIPWNKGKNNVYTNEQIKKMSNSHKGKKLPKEQCEKISNSLKGRIYSAQSLKKMSISAKGKNNWTKNQHWYNNGVKNIRAEVCPIGFVAGRLKQSHL